MATVTGESVACCGVVAALSTLLTLSCSSDAGSAGGWPIDGGPEGGGSGGSGASGGMAGAGGNGGAGGGPVDCSGSFGAPELVLDLGEDRFGSPAVVRGGTELLMMYGPLNGAWSFAHATRASPSDSFGALEPVPGLETACPVEPGGIDVTEDGLRAYFSCDDDQGVAGPLMLAERGSPDGAFTVLGEVASSLGGSAAVSADELTAYSNALGTGVGAPLVATRAATSVSFGAATEVAGLEAESLVAPDPSPDGLVLFAGQNGSVLGQAERASPGDPFGAFTPLSVGALDATGAPHITPDCRALYFVGLITGPPQAWGLYVMRR